MFEKQLSHHHACERKQRRPPRSDPLCGHLNIKALALTSNWISSCELSSSFLSSLPPYFFSPYFLHCLIPKEIVFFLLPPPEMKIPLLDVNIHSRAAWAGASTHPSLALGLQVMWRNKIAKEGARGCQHLKPMVCQPPSPGFLGGIREGSMCPMVCLEISPCTHWLTCWD